MGNLHDIINGPINHGSSWLSFWVVVIKNSNKLDI